MSIKVKGTGIELTDAIRQYVEEKFSDITKFFDNIQNADIDIGMRTQHHKKGKIFYAEINVAVPGKEIRIVKDSEDLYKAIDKVKDHLKSELKEFKERLRRKDKTVLRDQKEYKIED